jgi:hypothetical protein
MKKTTKKLVLAKETVRRLGNSDLERVAGGTTDYCGTGNIGCELAKIYRRLSGSC